MSLEHRTPISVRLLLILILLLPVGVARVSSAQSASSIAFNWAKKMGGTSYERGENIAIDGSGNVYSTGNFSSTTVDFDPGAGTFNLTCAGDADVFISKLDTNGNFVWAKGIGGTDDEFGTDIAVDGSGNVYTVGAFSGTVDFNPGTGTYNLTGAGSYDLFLSKLDPNGNFIWAKAVGGIANDQAEGLVLDETGKIYITGSFSDTVDFDPGSGVSNLTSAGGEDTFVAKFDNNGNLIWAKGMPGTDTIGNSGAELAVDGNGNVYTIGTFTSTVDFDPGAGVYNLSTGSYTNVFISKLDASGNFVWAKSMGGTQADTGADIHIDPSGFVISTGSFYSTADFDPGAGTYNLTSAGYWDNFVSKLDANGNFVWAKATGGTLSDSSYGLALDGSGNIYTTGGFAGTSDFDPGIGIYNLTSTSSSYDLFISKLDSSGNLLWAKSMGGTGDQYGMSIAVSAAGNIYTIGDLLGVADFDPGTGTYNLSSSGRNDIFISKLTETTQVRYVKWNATGSNNGTSWANAYTSLQTALTAAASGDEIWVAAGTYKPTTGTDRTISFVLKNGVRIYGGFAGTETALAQRNPLTQVTTLSGNIGAENNTDNSYHVVVSDATSSTTVLDGFTITGGYANGDSAANYDKGAGMFNLNGSPTLRRITFHDNRTGSYGHGGGLDTSGGSPMLTDVTFSSNYANVGAGIHNANGSLALTNVTFSDNSGANGGGMYNAGNTTTATLTNVTFSGNEVTFHGGGIYNSGSPVLTNVTFSGNRATDPTNGSGGAIYSSSGSPTIRNAILWGNTAATGAQIDGTVAISDSVVEGGYVGGTNISTADPLLGALDHHGGFTQTVPIIPGSSAIDTGNNASCAAADQRGITRPQDGDDDGNAICDRGAFEYIDLTPPAVLSSARLDPDPVSSSSIVRFTVIFSEDVTGVDTDDFVLTASGVMGATVTEVSGADTTYTVTVDTGVAGSVNGTLRLDLVDNDSIRDLHNNLLGGAGTGNGNFDTGDSYTIAANSAIPTLLFPHRNYVTNNTVPTFTWSAVTDASRYEIMFAADSAFTQGVDSYSAVDPTFTVGGPLPTGTYYWQVRAYNILDQPGAWSTYRSFTIDLSGPAAPTPRSPADTATVRTVPVFRWSTVSDAVLYQFELDNDSNFSSPLVSVEQRTTSRRPAGGLRGTYYWRVRAKDAAGTWGGWSTVFTVTVIRSR